MTGPRMRTCLMFVGEQYGRAEEAMNLYTSLFDDARIISVERYGPDEGGEREGLVKTAVFTLDGEELMALESGLDHRFTFTPAMSLFVTCRSGAEIERLAAVLGEGGQPLMPLGEYGFSERFAWLQDRFGVSWQLNLPRPS